MASATAPTVKFEPEKLSFTITSLTLIPMIRFTTILMKKVITLIQSPENHNLNSDVNEELVDFNGLVIDDDEDDESAPEFDYQGQ